MKYLVLSWIFFFCFRCHANSFGRNHNKVVSDLNHCYTLHKDGKKGSAIFHIKVDGEGDLDHVGINNSQYDNVLVFRCFARVFKRVHYPKRYWGKEIVQKFMFSKGS